MPICRKSNPTDPLGVGQTLDPTAYHYLECPCCGSEGAVSDQSGQFYDGQPLICPCAGLVAVDEDGDIYVSIDELPCAWCAHDVAVSQ
jgi:hypothetical protein